MNLIGGTSQFWNGGLSMGSVPGRPAPEPPVEPPADEPPVAGEDAATVIAGGSITIDVLANDTDPEGGPLTVVTAAAESGTVSIEADGTLLYIAAVGFTGTDTISYTIEDAGGNTAEGRATVTVTAPALSIDQANSTGDFTVDAMTGEITLTVIEPAQFAGTYVVSTADLALGPVNLAPPIIEGGTAAGDTVTAVPGLWAYDEAYGPLEFARLWYRGDTIIPEATEDTYVIQPEDVTAGLRHVRIAGQGVGTRAAEVVVLEPAPVVEEPAPEPTPFAEQGVVFSPDAHLIRMADLGPNGTDVLFFASFTPRTASASGIVMMPGDLGFGVAGDQKLRLRLHDGTSAVVRKGNAIQAGRRCHVLAAARSGGDGSTWWRMWSRQGVETEWTEGMSVQLTPGQTLVFAQGSFVVGANDPARTFLDATVFRIACWAAGPAPDISDPAVRESFVKADGTLEDPATSRLRYGAPRVDLYGSASDYAAGMNRGTAGNFDTVNGIFTDA